MKQPEGGPFKVLLVDDHPIFREALKALMSPRPELKVIGETGSGESALALIKDLNPDLVVMDIHMPGQGGLKTAKQIKETYPGVRVLMLSGSDNDSDLYTAVQNGAQGYLLKMVGSKELLAGILAAAHGEAVFSPSLATKALAALGARDKGQVEAATASGRNLSSQEQDVLGLVSRGYDNTKIAAELTLTEFAVSIALRNILHKLQVSSRAEAAVKGHMRGYDR